jgi:hypothetical protein
MTDKSRCKSLAVRAGLATLILWPSFAAAECALPPADAGSAEVVAALQCASDAASRASAARDAMTARLLEVYQAVDGDVEKRVDANQKAWEADAETSCPPLSNGTITVAASACEEKRYTERSNFLDEILAGCGAGACPVDKL